MPIGSFFCCNSLTTCHNELSSLKFNCGLVAQSGLKHLWRNLLLGILDNLQVGSPLTESKDPVRKVIQKIGGSNPPKPCSFSRCESIEQRGVSTRLQPPKGGERKRYTTIQGGEFNRRKLSRAEQETSETDPLLEFGKVEGQASQLSQSRIRWT